MNKCPRCGRKLIYRYEGPMRWKACPAKKACGWSVFTHGTHAGDEKREN
jgi:hypothetical protein